MPRLGKEQQTSRMTTLVSYKADLIQAALAGGVLKFGSFALKSGRTSPYLFNTGDFYRADLLQAIADAFADAIQYAVRVDTSPTTLMS